jgi:hypothetical protein
VAQVEPRHDLDPRRLEALAREHRSAARLELREALLERALEARRELRPADVRLAVPGDVGQAHAVRRQHAGERVHEHAADPEPARERAGVLAAGAAEHDERVLAHVVAARDRHLADRLGHVRVGDLEEAAGDLLERTRHAALAQLRPRRCSAVSTRSSCSGNGSGRRRGARARGSRR